MVNYNGNNLYALKPPAFLLGTTGLTDTLKLSAAFSKALKYYIKSIKVLYTVELG